MNINHKSLFIDKTNSDEQTVRDETGQLSYCFVRKWHTNYLTEK